jgi:hypothetical protein
VKNQPPTPLFRYVGPRYRVAWNPLTKFYDVADMENGGLHSRTSSYRLANRIAADLNRALRASEANLEPGERR